MTNNELPPDLRPLSAIPFASDPYGRWREVRVALAKLPSVPVSPDPNVPPPEDPHAVERAALMAELAAFEQARDNIADATRVMLVRVGCTTAQDIIDKGCTGLHLAGLSLDEIATLRRDLGGTGVGLPCYVPDDRYCRAHNTIGGLQGGQAPRFPEAIAAITRPLEPKEMAHKTLVEEAMRIKGQGRAARAIDMLTGHDLPEDMRADEAETPPQPVSTPAAPAVHVTATEALAAAALSDSPRSAAVAFNNALKLLALGVRYARETGNQDPIDGALQTLKGSISEDAHACLTFLVDKAAATPWKCPDHTKHVWACRYCVASKIVHNSFDVKLLLLPAWEDNRAVLDDAKVVEPTEADAEIERLGEDRFDAAAMYVKVTAWRRRFAEDV